MVGSAARQLPSQRRPAASSDRAATVGARAGHPAARRHGSGAAGAAGPARPSARPPCGRAPTRAAPRRRRRACWRTDAGDHGGDAVTAMAYAPSFEGLPGGDGHAGWLVTASAGLLNLWECSASGGRGEASLTARARLSSACIRVGLDPNPCLDALCQTACRPLLRSALAVAERGPGGRAAMSRKLTACRGGALARCSCALAFALSVSRCAARHC